MKRFLLSSLAALALTAGPAMAADYAPPAPEPMFSFSGFYLGGHAGYGWAEPGNKFKCGPWVDGGDGDWCWYDDDDFAWNWNHDAEASGFVGGVLGGFNMQSGSWLFGIEGDIGFADLSHNGWDGGDCGGLLGCGDRGWFNNETDWVAHIRGRLGWVFDRSMIFVAGGFAIAELGVDCRFCEFDWNDDVTLTGWTIGGGFEYAWTDNLLFRAEFLHDEFDEADFNDDWDNSLNIDIDANIVRGAIIFKFGGGTY